MCFVQLWNTYWHGRKNISCEKKHLKICAWEMELLNTKIECDKLQLKCTIHKPKFNIEGLKFAHDLESIHDDSLQCTQTWFNI